LEIANSHNANSPRLARSTGIRTGLLGAGLAPRPPEWFKMGLSLSALGRVTRELGLEKSGDE
jgi:hypothetical protein